MRRSVLHWFEKGPLSYRDEPVDMDDIESYEVTDPLRRWVRWQVLVLLIIPVMVWLASDLDVPLWKFAAGLSIPFTLLLVAEIIVLRPRRLIVHLRSAEDIQWSGPRSVVLRRAAEIEAHLAVRAADKAPR